MIVFRYRCIDCGEVWDAVHMYEICKNPVCCSGNIELVLKRRC